MERWIGKVAVVTGASSGIGRDISIKLVERGLKVVGCGRNLDNLIQVQKELQANSKGEFIPFKCDLSKEDDVLNMFHHVKNNLKELSVLINNAGVSFEGSIIHGETANWKAMSDVNVLGLCMCTREAFSLMHENEKSKELSDDVPGHIFNICSMAGHRVLPNSSFHFYSATKFAVTAITESIRQELREIKSNIRVTQICPGFVETEFQIRAGGQEMLDNIKKAIPVPLMASDISDAILFALSAPARSSVHDILIRPTVQAS